MLKKNLKGFTLIELIVTISIVSLVAVFLSAMLNPVVSIFSRTTQKTLTQSVCRTVAAILEEDLGHATQITLSDTLAPGGYSYGFIDGRLCRFIDGEGAPLLPESFYQGLQIRAQFSTESERFGKGNAGDILFLTIEAVNSKGEVVETLAQSCKCPNITLALKNGKSGILGTTGKFASYTPPAF